MAVVKDRLSDYASVLARGSTTVDASLVNVIASAIEKSQTKMMDRYLQAMADLLTVHATNITQSVSALCGVTVQADLSGGINTKAVEALNQAPLDEVGPSKSSSCLATTALHSSDSLNQPSTSTSPSVGPSSQTHCSGSSTPSKAVPSLASSRSSSNARHASKAVTGLPFARTTSNVRPANKTKVNSVNFTDDMDCQSVAFKRTGSPILGSPDSCPKQKTKKGQGSQNTGDILEAAVAAISSP